MPEQERFARKQSRNKRAKPPQPDDQAESNGRNGGGNYEQALVDYLQERIRPGLNRGSIPMVARSIARDLANGGSEQKLADYLQRRIKPGLNRGAIPLLARSIAKDLLTGSVNGSQQSHEDEQPEDPGDALADFEAEMHDLQSELGDEWIVRFSVWGDDAWLTAEKTDGTQHIEAPRASVLMKAAKLLDRRGGRSSG